MTLTLLLSLLANGQVTNGDVPDINTQSWRPSVDSRSFLWMTDSALMADKKLNGRALLAYSSPSLVYEDQATGDQTVLMGHLAELDLTGAYTYGPARLGLVVPIYLLGTSDVQNQTGLGDVVFDGKIRALDREEAPVGLSFSVRATAPTASVDLPLGSAGVLYELEAAVDQAFGKTLVALNIGHRGTPRVELENGAWDDQLYTRLGLAQSLGERSGLGAEWITQLSYASIDEAATLPSELLFEGWQGLNERGLVLRGGVGVGLGSAVAIPAARAIFTLAYEPSGEPDTDGDGFVDSLDACPNEPEDVDGRMDDDGCPDIGTVSLVFVDQFDKPVPGVSWTVGEKSGTGESSLQLEGPGHKVTASAEGHRTAELAFDAPDDGESTVRVELAAIFGSLVVRVTGPKGEDLSGASWVVVNDKEVTPTGTARALKPGTYSLRADADGYRSAGEEVTVEADGEAEVAIALKPAKAAVTAERIDIRESIYFETAKAVIKTESFDLLDEVSELLVNHPEITKVRIEGHTDSQGKEAYNLDLSSKRAESVRSYLIGKGVAEKRLESEGFGESRPLVPEKTATDRAKNRRVDFMVAERSDEPVEAPE